MAAGARDPSSRLQEGLRDDVGMPLLAYPSVEKGSGGPSTVERSHTFESDDLTRYRYMYL